MIYKGEREVVQIYKGDREVVEVYKGDKLVFQAGNFVLADKHRLRTATGEIFNCKEE